MPGTVKEKEVRPVDIAGINGPAFSLNIYRQGNTIFTTSLYEIDRILESRREDDEELSQQQAFAKAAAILLSSIDKYAEDDGRV